MAISQKTQNRLDQLVAAIKDAKALTLNERDDCIEILNEAAAGTNGLTVEEKTQANSVNIFNLCYLFIRDKLEGGGYGGGFWPALFRLLERCRWQVTIIAGFVSAVLAFRPQFAAIIEAALR